MENNTFTMTAPVSIWTQDDTFNDGKKVHRMSIRVSDLAEVPEALFATKISQSKNAERAGKLLFKYLSFRFTQDGAYSDHVPSGFKIDSPLKEVKAAVVAGVANASAKNPEGIDIRLTMKVPGRFATILADGDRFTLFDEEKFPETDGKPNYFLKNDVPVTITFTPAESHGNTYYQLAFASDHQADDLFQKVGKVKVWGEDEDAAPSVASPDAADGAGW